MIISISMFRPDAVINSYWMELLDIGQNDDLLPVELLMEDICE